MRRPAGLQLRSTSWLAFAIPLRRQGLSDFFDYISTGILECVGLPASAGLQVRSTARQQQHRHPGGPARAVSFCRSGLLPGWALGRSSAARDTAVALPAPYFRPPPPPAAPQPHRAVRGPAARAGHGPRAVQERNRCTQKRRTAAVGCSRHRRQRCMRPSERRAAVLQPADGSPVRPGQADAYSGAVLPSPSGGRGVVRRRRPAACVCWAGQCTCCACEQGGTCAWTP